MTNTNYLYNYIKWCFCSVFQRTGGKLWWVFVLIWVLPNSVQAKVQNADSLQLSVSKTMVNATNEELVDFVVKVQNRSSVVLEASLSIQVDSSLELVSKTVTNISIQPGKSFFAPIKIFVNKKAVSGIDHIVHFILSNSDNETLAELNSNIKVNIKRNVNLFSLVSNILIDNNTDSIRIPVRISNSGNTIQKITVLCFFPSAIQAENFHTATRMILLPSADTLVYFSKPVNRKMMHSDGFNITVSGLYENSDVIGMAYVRVQSARSDRSYQYPDRDNRFNDNSFSLSTQSMFSPTQSYSLRGRGQLDLAGGKLGYNLDLTTWKKGYSSSMLRSTWLSYQANNAGIKIGNLNENFDINLSGRGITGFINDTASGNHFEAGFLEGNTNLLSNKLSLLIPAGQAGWGVFSHSRKQLLFTSYGIYENNPGTNSRNVILGNSFQYTSPSLLRFTGSINVGHTSEYINTQSHKFGMAISGGITGTIGNISLNSYNYYSSGYYPGIQRGAVSLSERVTWIRPASTVWINFDYHNYSPKILSGVQFFLPSFGTLRAEAGIAGKLKNINASISPGFSKETSNAYQLNGTVNSTESLSALDIYTTLNFPMAESQYASVNTQSGFYSSSFDLAKKFHLKSTLQIKKGIFNLNATLQMGAFFMGEAANNYINKINAGRLINIIPTIQKNFLHGKLKTELGIAYMTSSSSGDGWYLAGRMEYEVTSKTGFFTSVNYNRYNGYGSSIIEMGITQNIQLPKAGTKNNELELFFFKDINQDGLYNEGDTVANNYLLYINDDIFVSSATGTVNYKNLPDGNYRLFMPVGKGWYAPEKIIKLDRKTHVSIALNKTGTLKGNIKYVTDEFSYEINHNLSGITILATDSNKRIFKTKSNASGHYVFYVPIGEYAISIDQNSIPLKTEVISDNQAVKILSENTKQIDFRFKVKSRKVEVKKFISPALIKSRDGNNK